MKTLTSGGIIGSGGAAMLYIGPGPYVFLILGSLNLNDIVWLRSHGGMNR